MGVTGASRLCSVVPALFVLCSPAAAQSATQTLVQSFSALQSIVKPAQRVIVTDNTGHKHAGRVIAVGNQLEMDPGQKRRLLSMDLPIGRPQGVFSEDTVRRIENDDSTLNGLAIGSESDSPSGLRLRRMKARRAKGQTSPSESPWRSRVPSLAIGSIA